MQHPKIIVAGTLVAALAAAGGITAAVVTTSPASAATASGHSATMATVRTAQVAVGGKMESILTTASGQPLYYYQPDTATKSLVSGGLAALWPPLSTSTPTGTGLSGQLSLLNGPNGQVVTYNGHPLYTFVDDHAGQVTGQGVQNFFVATPGMATLSGAPAAGGYTPPAGPAGGHSYGIGY